jgi:hypothetical protein
VATLPRVSERWVCKRCYADNDGDAAACARCGLGRGEVPPAEEQHAWQTGAASAAPASGARRWLRFWWVPALAGVLIVGYLVSARRDDQGSITSGGTLSVTELRAGDCFDLSAGQNEEFSSVDAKPCTEPHEFEIYHTITSDASTFPNSTDDEALFVGQCMPAFQDYVGRTYEGSALWSTLFGPTQSSWDAGDRGYSCVLYQQGERPMTGSMRGANR